MFVLLLLLLNVIAIGKHDLVWFRFQILRGNASNQRSRLEHSRAAHSQQQ
jgi:hypothetical protein